MSHNVISPSTRDMDLVLEALLRRHGYDFRGYARPSLRRRLAALAGSLGVASMSGLAGRILEDGALLPILLAGLSVPVTEMFRDPTAFAALRPRVKELARRRGGHLTIWQAGCATGEETFSLLILLAEEGLLDRCRIFATDLNGDALRQAMAGCLPSRRLPSAARAHQASGGQGALTARFRLRGDIAWLAPELLNPVTWRHHTLVGDPPPCAPDLIVCRNVLTYFDDTLCQATASGFLDILGGGGLLWIGMKENIRFTISSALIRGLSGGGNIYEKL